MQIGVEWGLKLVSIHIYRTAMSSLTQFSSRCHIFLLGECLHHNLSRAVFIAFKDEAMEEGNNESHKTVS